MGSHKQHSQAQSCKVSQEKFKLQNSHKKMATQNREITKYCCCNSNISGAKAFAITYMVTLIPIGILMAIIWTVWKETFHFTPCQPLLPTGFSSQFLSFLAPMQ